MIKKITKQLCRSLRRVALYLRLSKEDLEKNPEESSESIKNQELMLRKYAEENGWEVVGVYEDEDYSGSDRDRPNFNKMISECEKGNIDIVLVKTQARFARDIELVDKYIHNKFKEWGVRFVACVDRIDSTKKETKKASQITAMTDEWYLEDTSENIKATLRNKKEKGLFTSSQAPYGYLKDPDDKNHLIVDPVASENVKKIFELYKMGWGYVKILNYLNSENILCPYDYKRLNGIKIGNSSCENRKRKNIQNMGNYIIFNTIENLINEKYENIITLGTLVEELGSPIKKNVKMKVRKIDKNMQLFYSTSGDKNIKIEDLTNENEYHKLNENDYIPNESKYVICLINELKRYGKVSYELEVEVPSNNNNAKLNYLTEVLKENNIFSTVTYEKKPSWSMYTIREMLRNETYIGNTVQGKYEKISYKIKKSRHKPHEEWIVVENMHDPIIDKDTWYSVQSRMNNQPTCQFATGTLNPFSKKVYCKYCGKAFSKTKSKQHEYLVCSDKQQQWRNCDNRSLIRLDLLEKDIIKQINENIEKYKNGNLLKQLNQEMIDNKYFNEKNETLKKELQKIENEINKKDKFFQHLYEDKINETITTEQYFLLVKQYEEDKNNLIERSKKITNEIKMIAVKQEQMINSKNLFEKYNKVTELSSEIISEWIDKIIVGKKDKDTGLSNIEIQWNF